MRCRGLPHYVVDGVLVPSCTVLFLTHCVFVLPQSASCLSFKAGTTTRIRSLNGRRKRTFSSSSHFLLLRIVGNPGRTSPVTISGLPVRAFCRTRKRGPQDTRITGTGYSPRMKHGCSPRASCFRSPSAECDNVYLGTPVYGWLRGKGGKGRTGKCPAISAFCSASLSLSFPGSFICFLLLFLNVQLVVSPSASTSQRTCCERMNTERCDV